MRFIGGSIAERLCLVLVVAALPTIRAAAQPVENLASGAAYGSGVHAYFAGDYTRSYECLSDVVHAGSLDPRSRYFRGLAALQLGRLDEAEAEFSEGAELEARGFGAWPVGRSLERIQGADRLRLERHRMRARLAAMQESRESAARRYSEIEDAQDEVLRRRRPSASGGSRDRDNVFEDAPAAAPIEVIPEPPAASAPAAGEQAAPETEAPAAEAAPAEAADPFSEPAAEAPPAVDP